MIVLLSQKLHVCHSGYSNVALDHCQLQEFILFIFFLACPGILTNPCSSHGKCDDGKAGAGHCQCEADFTGTSCEKCIPRKYGRNCTNGKSEFTCT